MPSIFRATIGLKQPQWAWHRANPGRLSQLAQKAVDQEIALDALPDGLRDDALEVATAAFFVAWQLQGDYAVIGHGLARHKATEEQMAQDASWLNVPPEKLLPTLQDLFDLELEMQMRKRIILAEARKEMA
jgi:hypothetical protein